MVSGAPTTCAQRSDAALLAGSFTVASTFFGAVSPVGQCNSCKAGQASYYPDSGRATPMAEDQKAIGGLTCANLCVCSADGTCYTRTDNNVNVVLYPFCDGGSCSVYAVVIAQNDNSGLRGTDGSTVTAASQIDPVTVNRLPVTSGRYPKITLASCNGCSSPTTC
ncbi:hypothetical protein M3Y97_00058800 [Aphelenchoides bicaudatus]|nr:hypothetical protein M3Y97_00058800 [Aphelenchoides bicaudatus]